MFAPIHAHSLKRKQAFQANSASDVTTPPLQPPRWQIALRRRVALQAARGSLARMEGAAVDEEADRSARHAPGAAMFREALEHIRSAAGAGAAAAVGCGGARVAGGGAQPPPASQPPV